MKIRNLLSGQPLVRLGPTRSVLEATQHMVEAKCGSVLVIDSKGAVKGIFTERDLMVRVVSKGLDPATTAVREVMTSELYTTDPDRKVAEVRREMGERHIRHVPVLEGGKVLAVLSVRDLLRADFEETREDARAMTDYIRGEMLGNIRPPAES